MSPATYSPRAVDAMAAELDRNDRPPLTTYPQDDWRHRRPIPAQPELPLQSEERSNMTPSSLDIVSDFNGEETAAEYRRRVPGDSTRSHWSRRRAKVRRQWRERARRIER